MSSIIKLKFRLLLCIDIVITKFLVNAAEINMWKVGFGWFTVEFIKWSFFTRQRVVILLNISAFFWQDGIFRVPVVAHFASCLGQLSSDLLINDGAHIACFLYRLSSTSSLKVVIVCWVLHPLIRNLIYYSDFCTKKALRTWKIWLKQLNFKGDHFWNSPKNIKIFKIKPFSNIL
jgi:hypothetical protein